MAGAGVLVAPGDVRAVADAIADLAREPERRLALSREARHRAWEISWHHSEKALLHAYAAALGRTEDPQWPESRSAGDRNERNGTPVPLQAPTSPSD